MRPLWNAALLAAAVLLATPAMAAPEIEYAYPDQSVWTAQVDANGAPVNPLLKLAKVLFAEAGIPWHGAPYPASRMFTLLRTGAAQFSMLVAAPTLAECCLVSREPVARTEVRVYWMGNTPPARQMTDLLAKSAIVIRGYSYGPMANFLTDERNAISRSIVDTHRSAFQMLEHGRADYLIDYTGPASEVLAARPVPGIHSAVLAPIEVHLVLSRTYPDAEAVMAKLEAIAVRLDKERILRAP